MKLWFFEIPSESSGPSEQLNQSESVPSIPLKLNPFQTNLSTTKTFQLVCNDPPAGLSLCEQSVIPIQVIIADTMWSLLSHAVSNQ